MQQVPNPYLLVARMQWLRVNCVENRNLTSAENLKLTMDRKPTFNSSILVMYPLSQPRRMGYPLGSFHLTPWWVVECRASEKYTVYMASSNKKSKQNLSESDSENESADFPRFIVVIESLEEVCLAKFSPFLIEKVISTRDSPKTVKKTRNGNLLVEVDSWRQAKNILKIKTFHTTKCRAYSHEKLNTSKGVIRSRELALATEYEIVSALGKQGVTNIKRICIRKGEQRIQTNTYILTFNKPRTPKVVKIGYCFERVEQYVPAPLRYFKCQKFGHHWEACRRRQIFAKCSEKDLDHAEKDCLKEIQCANGRQDHPAYARTCAVYQKEKEIIELKHKRDFSFLEARRIVGSYMGESTCTSVARGRGSQWQLLVWIACGEVDQVGGQWLARVSGAPGGTALGWILPGTSSATGCKWGEIQCCGPSGNICGIYHSGTSCSWGCRVTIRTAVAWVTSLSAERH